MLVGECSHSETLPYWAFVMVLLYWGARFPPVESLIPHISGITNTAAASFTGMAGWQTARQAWTRLRRWWSRHVEITGRATFSLGKRPRDGDTPNSGTP